MNKICPYMSGYVEQSRNRGFGTPDIAQGGFHPVECMGEQCQCWVREYTTGKKIIKIHEAHCGMVSEIRKPYENN